MVSSFILSAFAALPFISSANAVKLFSNATIPRNITSGCANALLADVDCSPTVSFIKGSDYYPEATLNRTCTDECSQSLGNYAVQIASSCDGENWNGYGDEAMPVSVIPDLLRYELNLTCISDSGRWCNMVAAQAAYAADPSAGDPVYGPSIPTGSNSSAPSDVDQCDLCLIKNLQFQAESPYYDGPDLVSIYSSKTQSCGVSTLPLSATSTLSFTLTSTSSPTSTPCAGKTYTIQPGDTCYSISQSQGIGTGWLLLDNNLEAYCANFPTNGSLCLQDTCKTTVVQQNDTCASIASQYNITSSQLVSFNPVIIPGCFNIDRLNGSSLCVSAPGTPYVAPSPTSLAPLTATAPAPVPSNARDNSTRDCGMWYNVAEGDYCNMIVLKFGISLPDFVFLNPTINENCTNLLAGISYCVEPVGDINTYPSRSGVISTTSVASYTPWSALPDATTTSTASNTSATSLPYANGTRADCNFYFAGDNFQQKTSFWSSVCALAAHTYNVDLTAFGTWNQGLNVSDPSCSFQEGVQYCGKLYFGEQAASTALPHEYPIRDGSDPACTAYADAWNGRSCQDILTDYNITIAEFYAWNSAVGSDCGNMWPEYSYCVAAPEPDSVSTTTVSGTPTTTTSGGPSPTAPTQSGEPTNCVKWDEAISGDSCDKIANRNFITTDQFYAWNPAVSKDCSSGFFAGYDYCVGTSDTASTTRASTSANPTTTSSGVPAPTPNQANNAVSNCDKYAQTESGDYCSAFADRNGITLQQLYAWNSVLGSDGSGCSNNFWAGYYYCVGVSS